MEDNNIVIKKSENKGFGYFCENEIKENCEIFSENILISIKSNNMTYNEIILKILYLVKKNKKLWNKFIKFSPESIDSHCISYEQINNIISSLKPKSEKYLKIFNDDDKTKLQLYYEKVKRNIFECSGMMFLLFKGTFFNHSCKPNVLFFVNPDNKLVRFISNRNIKKEEELTISYIDTRLSKNILSNVYGFVCECELCLN